MRSSLKTRVGVDDSESRRVGAEAPRHHANGNFLPARPVHSAIGRIVVGPILNEPPKPFDVALFPTGGIRSSEQINNGKPAWLPNKLHFVNRVEIDLRSVNVIGNSRSVEYVCVPIRRKSHIEPCLGEVRPLTGKNPLCLPTDLARMTYFREVTRRKEES